MFRILFIATLTLTSFVGPNCLADIIFTGGSADLGFFYESVQDRWDVAFVTKSSTVATGLDTATPYAGFTGIVGNTVHTFWKFPNTLSTNFTTDRFLSLGSTTYAISRAAGSPFNLPSDFANNVSPDLGFRPRLRENEVALGTGSNTAANQFDSLNLTLDLAASTFNGTTLANIDSPHVGLVGWDSNTPVALIDSANGQLTANFSNFGHFHRNWGFSKSGQYNLIFEIEGVGGTYGSTASTGGFSVQFNVTAIPEPSSLLLITAASVGLAFRRSRRHPRPLIQTGC
jgi:hypothetical protein